MKLCKKCNLKKSFNLMVKDSSRSDGYRYLCKQCKNENSFLKKCKCGTRLYDEKIICSKCEKENNFNNYYLDFINKTIGDLFIKKIILKNKNKYFVVLCLFENCNKEFDMRCTYLSTQNPTFRCDSCSRKKDLIVSGAKNVLRGMNNRNKIIYKRIGKKFKNINLNVDDIINILIDKKCHVSGCHVSNDRVIKLPGGRLFRCNSADRINPDLPYAKENILSSCVMHNMDRNRKTIKEYDEKLGERALQTVLHQYEDKLSTRTKNELKRLLNVR